jgi:hypothetical protein
MTAGTLAVIARYAKLNWATIRSAEMGRLRSVAKAALRSTLGLVRSRYVKGRIAM